LLKCRSFDDNISMQRQR